MTTSEIFTVVALSCLPLFVLVFWFLLFRLLRGGYLNSNYRGTTGRSKQETNWELEWILHLLSIISGFLFLYSALPLFSFYSKYRSPKTSKQLLKMFIKDFGKLSYQNIKWLFPLFGLVVVFRRRYKFAPKGPRRITSDIILFFFTVLISPFVSFYSLRNPSLLSFLLIRIVTYLFISVAFFLYDINYFCNKNNNWRNQQNHRLSFHEQKNVESPAMQ